MYRIALLRAVNLAGRNAVPMAELRKLVAGLGFTDVRTHLQSGNLVFRSPHVPDSALEARLERAVLRHLGLKTDIFIRTAQQWRAVIEANPFPEQATQDPQHLLVMVLRNAPDHAAVERLQQSIVGREEVRAGVQHLYVYYPDGVGRSKLTNAAIQKTIGASGTARNWNTVLALGRLVAEE